MYFVQNYGKLCLVEYASCHVKLCFYVDKNYLFDRNFIDMTVNDVGDIVLLFCKPPWMQCVSVEGNKIWTLKRHHHGMMYYPQRVLSASSGMNYVNDPPTMYDFL